MKVTEQIDALRVMATSPVRYLVVPRFLAASLMMPVLIVFGNFIGNAGGYFVAHYYADISSFTYINSIKQFCETFDIVGGMIKGVAFGAIISTVGCFKGLHADKGAEGVGLATTASVVLSIILIFIADYFMTCGSVVAAGGHAQSSGTQCADCGALEEGSTGQFRHGSFSLHLFLFSLFVHCDGTPLC